MDSQEPNTSSELPNSEKADQLSSAKKALLEQRLRRVQTGSLQKPVIPRRPSNQQEAPASFAQERMWFLEQLAPGSAVYHVPLAIPIPGTPAPQALAHALTLLVARHESLRTSFPSSDGIPQQFIHPAAPVELPLIDLRALPAAQAATTHRALASATAQQPFDLARQLPFRALLVWLPEQTSVLLLTFHHICVDGWSLGILLREFQVISHALAAGQQPSLPPLPIQYADYALWQRHTLTPAAVEQQLAFWRTHLADCAPLLLPTDAPRPTRESAAGATYAMSLDATTTTMLNATAQQQQATLFMVVLTALALVLHRWTAQSHFAIGTPVANRTRPELEPLIGLFVNTLALPVTITPATTLGNLLASVRSTALDAYAHQDVPFEHVVEAVQPVRDPNHSPVFQVMCVVQNTRSATSTLRADLGAVPLAGASSTGMLQQLNPTGTAKFDLTLTITERQNTLEVFWEYRRDLWQTATIARLADHWLQAVQALATSPEMLATHVELLTDAEKSIISALNNTTQPYPLESLAMLFKQQVKKTPTAIALEWGSTSLTYEELDQRSNQLAHYLQHKGIHPGTRIGLFFDRSIDFIVSVLSTIKIGAVYVPLDISYPQNRIEFMIKDSEIVCILSHQELKHVLPPLSINILTIDTDKVHIQQHSHKDLTLLVPVDQPAYIMYTSGSTGIPKGISISHRNIIRLLFNTNYVNLSSDERIAHISNISFDAATFEIWGSLLYGGRLIGLERETILSPVEFINALRNHRITTLFITSALFNACIKESADAFCTVRKVLTGGEAASAAIMAQVLQSNPPQALVNAYGPTESTTFALYHPVSSEDLYSHSIPIGKPISNTTAYVLDKYMQQVPLNVVGELYLGGDGLSSGYVQRPALTAERFVPHPWSSTPGARLYRTGDLVRLRADGQIEYVGRRDTQIKLRGFRIELGEVQAVLEQAPGVAQAAVLVHAETPDTTQLVGYVVPHTPDLSEATLRSWLEQQLPSYMVPGALLLLPAFPLTPNGKLDHAALPAPHTMPPASTAAAPPATPTEELVAATWSNVLGQPITDRQANFFAYGGHSLLATRVTARLQATLNRSIPVRLVFEAPILAAFAARLDALTAPTETTLLPPIVSAPRPQHLPLSFAQERMWFLEQLVPDSAVYHVPLALPVAGTPSPQALAHALTLLVARHESLRTSFPSSDGMPYQFIHPPAPVLLPLIDLRTLPASQAATAQRALASATAQQPFDLAQQLPFRALLVWLSEQTSVLLLTLHHICVDGWSLGILLREFQVISHALAAGQQPSLPPLPIQYADYTLWQRHSLTPAAVEQQLAFWRTHLADCAPLLLPTDAPRPTRESAAGATYSMSLDSTTSAMLNATAQQQQATLFMVVLAALALVLHRWTAQNHFAIGTPVANRTRPELEPLIGLFVNTLALPVTITPTDTLADLLASLRSTALDAYAHQDVPFEHVVEAVQPVRDPSRSPIFQVMCIVQNTRSATNTLRADLGAVPVGNSPANMSLQNASTTGTAKFDLTLTITERQDILDVQWEYRRDLWQDATISRMADYWLQAVQALATTPDLPIARLALLTSADHAALAALAPPLPPTPPLLLTERFRAQATRSPHAPALHHPASATTLAYADLLEQAEHLAAHLLAHGLTPDRPVAVLLPRSPDLVVALLAVLLAGGCYLPLDPAYPAERLRFMLADTQAPLVLISEETRPLLPPHTGRTLDVQRLLATPAASASPPPAIHPQQLAYLIYTSGSTGTPKGVAITHANAAAFLAWASATFTPADLHATLATTSVCFDLSIFELFAPLCCGGSVILLPDALALPTVDTALAPTLLNTVPSVLAALLPLAPLPPSLRVIALAGEALPVPLATELLTHTTAQLYNLYGPSEDTTYSTWACFSDPAALASAASVPIGQPISATQAFILDPTGQQVPVGVVGELYLGGAGLARGYLGRPALTAERFVPHPWSSTPGARVYRTGDLVRLRADGPIEYVGRRDTQIKLRGFRIELGEVQAVLEQAPGVAQAAVLVHADTPATAQLVGYVVPHSPDLSEATLRSWLDQQLPAYMVPSVLLLLPAFPRTPNGKLDRAALPAPNAMLPASTAAAPPATPTEELVAATWSSVLGQSIIDRQANFFAYGGHSLLATRVTARLQTALNRSVPVRLMFEAPTLAAFAARLDVLTAPTETSLLSPLVAAPRPQHLPLSFAQERMWFLEQMASGSAVYHVPLALPIPGTPSPQALAYALSLLVARHESLRTTFPSNDGMPYQFIHPSAPVVLPLIDLRSLPTAQTATVQRALASATAQQPFDLAQQLPFRALLVWLSEQTSVLLLTLHHICVDGWSLGILLREFQVISHALAAGQQPSLPPLPIQYADYALWQRHTLTPAAVEQQLAFWRSHLADCAPLMLPTDFPRPLVTTNYGETRTITLDAATTTMLRNTAQEQQATLFMVVLAALALVLHRWTAQSHFAIGTPVANRTRSELEPLIGLFVNTLALPVTITSTDTLADLLASLRSTALDAYAHQDVPFEHVVEAVQPVRDPSRSPIFQVMCVVQNTRSATSTLRAELGATLESNVSGAAPFQHANPTGTAKFDLTLTVMEYEENLELYWEYRRDLWQGATIERLADHWLQAVHALATTPNQPVARLALLTPTDHTALAALALPCQAIGSALLPDRIRAQVARTPHAAALIDPESATTLSYTELLEQAEQLAAHLLNDGLMPDTPVAILLPRSPDLVVALLAVLLAGGCYLALDPTYPAERLRFMLADSQAPLVLISDETRRLLPPHTGRALNVQRLLATPAASASPPPAIHPQQLAYLIYTSGSTGTPKGVAISHEALMNHMQWMNSTFPLSAFDRVVQKTPLNFDASVWELYAPLLSGATLILGSPTIHLEPDQLINLIQTQAVTVLQVVPTQLQLLLHEGMNCLSLRRLYCGGEALTTALVLQAQAQLPAVEIYNLYGPTEVTIDATWAKIQNTDQTEQLVPIGQPITNIQAYILDSAGLQVPAGVVGELYLGGTGLARGYHGRPALTAERFVPHPWSSTPGARLYRSGDFVRLRSDGQLEYLGRSDNQVKLRGYRIELNEIQAVLEQAPGVAQAAVFVRPDGAGTEQLVAYIVAQTATKLASETVRTWISSQLPHHMLPGSIMVLEAFPQLPNGKLDRAALPSPVAQQQASNSTFIARDRYELTLIQIWEKLLATSPISIQDDFFALGGHSLLAIRLMAQIERDLGQRLPITTLFQAPSIKHLAEVLRQGGHAHRQPTPLVPLQTQGTNPPLFLVHPIGGSVTWYRELSYTLGTNQPCYALQAYGIDAGTEPLHAIPLMAQRYIEALRTVQPHGPYALAGWSFGGIVALEMARQLHHQAETVMFTGLIDSYKPNQEQIDETTLLQLFIRDLLGINLPISLPEDQSAWTQDTLEAALSQQPSQGIYAGWHKEDLQRLYTVFRAHYHALHDYQAQPYHGHVVLFGAGETQAHQHDRLHGFQTQLQGTYTIIDVPGTHYSLLKSPHVEVLAQQIQAHLQP